MNDVLQKLEILRRSFLDVFSVWDKICADEKKFILYFDLKKLEANTESKKKIADKLENLSVDLVNLFSEICELNSFKIENISIRNLTQLVNQKISDGASNPDLHSVLRVLNSLEEQLHSYYSGLKSNSILIEKMLESHNKSVVFWQGFAKKQAASYDKNGQRKVQKTSTQLSVKA